MNALRPLQNAWLYAVLVLSLTLPLLAIAKTERPVADRPPIVRVLPLGLPTFPAPWYFQKAYVEFGEFLFFSELLSSNATSCATCHIPQKAFSGPPLESETTRDTPPLFNLAYTSVLMWDGRANSIESQVFLPLEGEHEMKIDWDTTLQQISRTAAYSKFKTETSGRKEFATKGDVIFPLSAYVASLVAGNSEFDKYQYGQVALTESAERGLDVFRNRGKCESCHDINGKFALFSDSGLHSIALVKSHDAGRGLVTGIEADNGQFKTPTLRNIFKTAPYGHNGSIADVRTVLEIYNRGGVDSAFETSGKIRQLGLTRDDISDMEAFLRSLSSEIQSYRPWQ